MRSLLTVLCVAGFAASTVAEERPWWQSGAWTFPKENPQAKELPLISVDGNRFVNPDGERVLFRGLAIADPDKLAGQGEWKKELFVAVKEMGANIVRLPVHPVAWQERGGGEYMKLLDEAVAWSTELEMYIIIDWHSIGNLVDEVFQNPMYDTSRAETFAFWRSIAAHFKGHNTVAFYELFNEPTMYRGQLGHMTWTEWKELNEEMIRIIRYSDKQTIPLVAGFDWAYDLNSLRYEPIRAEGIGYTVHPYANKRSRPWEPKWEENFGFAAETYPVMATEWGFGFGRGEKPKNEDDRYENRITRYLEGRGISWVGWVFDAEWHPRMLESFDGYELKPNAEFIKIALTRDAVPVPAKEP